MSIKTWIYNRLESIARALQESYYKAAIHSNEPVYRRGLQERDSYLAASESVSKLEKIFKKISNESYPSEWDENHITYQLMKELRKLYSDDEKVDFNGFSKLVNWRSFKNRGKLETKYGDIAIIVNIQFSSGETLRGIATIEAKKKYGPIAGIEVDFAALDKKQLSRIKENSPYSHLLLYSYSQEILPLKYPDKSEWPSYFWVSPINTVQPMLNEINRLNTNSKHIYRISFPFSMLIISRIFWGHDLDYRVEVYDDIVNGINKIINPDYLAVVDVFYQGQTSSATTIPEFWEEI
ncbi:MAG: hypothetical protein V4649_09160 [Bacteroidota bacterium]